MPAYRMGQVAELLGTSVDTVRRWADAGRFPTERTAAGYRVVDGVELARFMRASADSPGGEPLFGAQSTRNRFPGIVTRVAKDGLVAQVEIQAGPYRVVSLMTREAADELRLEPGMLATAAVKATNVIVELPASPS
jgi:molybdopterin-binding protein